MQNQVKKNEFMFGNVKITPNFFLSPMHGVTDRPFRRLTSALSQGKTGLHVSEFVAVESLGQGVTKENNLMIPHSSENLFCAQIFGVDLQAMELAANKAVEHGAKFLELNCGCPAPKVVKRGGGSGLLRDLPHMSSILKVLRKTIKIPLSVKVRIGWSDDEITLQESHKVAQNEGADLFVIHGRTRLQGYRGLADWNKIAEIKQLSKIPIIGNGDIIDAQDAIDKLDKYGVDGVSIGRGAMHNPWIFDEYHHKVNSLPWNGIQSQNVHQAMTMFKGFMEEDGLIEKRYMGRLKQVSARIFKCIKNGEEYRGKLLRSNEWVQFEDYLYQWSDELKQMGVDQDILSFENLGNLNGKPDRVIQSGQDFKR
tara:strand:- start:112 stop:1212 length:1101 start_codon:yes stop_codon:yes gene_type:complete